MPRRRPNTVCRYGLRTHIEVLTAVLGGLDSLAFSGGVGECTVAVRWEAWQGLVYWGIALDPKEECRTCGSHQHARKRLHAMGDPHQ
jgi:acetate kinase